MSHCHKEKLTVGNSFFEIHLPGWLEIGEAGMQAHCELVALKERQ